MLHLPPHAAQPPLLRSRDDAPAYWFIDIVWYVLAHGDDTGGAYSVMEQWMRRGSGPPVVHTHSIDEWFYVIEGTMEMEVAGKTLTAGPGASVWIPRGTPHRFKVTSEVAKALNGYTPAGFEQVIIGLAKTAERRELPPPMDPPDAATAGRIFNNYWTCQSELGWAAT